MTRLTSRHRAGISLTTETGEVRMGEFTIAFWTRNLPAFQRIHVHASNGMIAASWFWQLMDDVDQDTYFETIIYPAIRDFVASWSCVTH